MLRNTLLTAGIVLATTSTLVQAGPGCMNGNRTSGWQPMQAMPAPGHGSYPRMPGYGYAYGTPGRGMAMPGPQYSPMMAGAPGSRYAPPAAAPAASSHQTAAANRVNATPVGESASGENITVRIKGMQFEPATVKIRPGTTVTWLQQDGSPHTVTVKGGEPQSSTLMGGQSFTHTFSDAGEYEYACNFHPMMKGLVVVEEEAS